MTIVGTFALCSAPLRRMVLLTVLITTPVWAMTSQTPPGMASAFTVARLSAVQTIEPLSVSAPSNTQDGYLEAIRSFESFPDVEVFSVWAAGPVVANDPRHLLTKVAQAGLTGSIAVIYPDIGEPYRSVFSQIISGIEEKVKGVVNNFSVGPNVDMGELNNSLKRQDTRVVIALGRQGMKVADALDGNMSVVVGGVLSSPESSSRNHQINSLSPDPALLFTRLKSLMPKVRRIYAVYDPRQNAWMMRLAKDAARTQGVELVTREALDLRSAMLAYQEILAGMDSSKDALWLPQDSTTVDDGSVLPLVLQESWSHNLAVFSSSFNHVKRGVLFSLYPNNVELGHHLADSALGFLATGGSDTSGIFPLREVLMAVNLRTAKHLELSNIPQQGFAMVFPER